MSKSLALSVICTLILLVSGCGNSTEPGGSSSVVGTYTLKTINGTSLPFVAAQTGADKVEVTGGSISVNAGGSYTAVVTYKTTVNGSATTSSESDAGSWIQAGTALTFTSTDASQATGSVTGSTLTITDSGFAYVYKK